MTYCVLARKWRPQTFYDLVGQTHVVRALTYALSQDKVHHAYLFTGTRGVGKTSIARIFAKSLNCETNGVSANPCGTCQSCLEIAEGRFVDLIEVDAASRTGVDETRELIDSVAYLPTKGRYKVYLIDEVHMFSKSSFNALLKTLEEPPPHVKFILATTDPDKLPNTILSRCIQFSLKSLTEKQIQTHLQNICDSESIRFENNALALLAKAGRGSLRDALSLTDQAITFGQGQLTTNVVAEILGTVHPADIEAILFAIATNNANQLNVAIRRLDEYDIDASTLLSELMRYLQQMAWAKEGIVNTLPDSLLSTLHDLPKPLLHVWYDIADKALMTLRQHADGKQVVEMTCLRMLAFIPEGWVPRHRTLLDGAFSSDSSIESSDASATEPDTNAMNASVPLSQTDTNAVDAADIQQPTQESAQQEAAQQEAAATPSAEPHEFAQQVRGRPVEVGASLADSEQAFIADVESFTSAALTDASAASAASADENAPAQATENHQEQALGINAPADGQEAETKIPEASEQNVSHPYNLSAIDDEDVGVPTMQDIQAVMTSARTISKKQKSEDSQFDGQSDTQSDNQSDEKSAYEAVHQTVQQSSLSNKPLEREGDNAPETQDNQGNQNNQANNSAEQNSAKDTDQSNVLATFDWFTVIDQLALSEFTYHFVSAGILRVHGDESGDGVSAMLDLLPANQVLVTDASLDELNQALSAYFKTNVSVSVNYTDLREETPADREKQQQTLANESMLREFSGHPMVSKVINELGGKVLEQTIQASKKPS